MRSMTFKLTLAFLIVGLAGVVLVAVTTGVLTRREFDRFVADRYQLEVVEQVADYYQTNGGWDGLESILQTRAQGGGRRGGPGQSTLLVFDAEGGVIVDNRPAQMVAEVANPTLDRNGAAAVEVDGETIGYVQFFGAPMERGELSPETTFLAGVSRATIWSALGASVLALILGAALARTISRPVRELTQATKAVAAGELGAQVPVRGDDELGELAHSFNRMSADLAQSNQVRKQMTADIAHDLRTPLSVILGYAEALQDGKLPGAPDTYAAIYLQAQHLNRLIDDLRTLSLADAGQLSLQKRIVLPRTLLEHTALAYLPHAEAQGITLAVEGDDAPPVLVDPDRLIQVLGNLIANALRHTPDGGQITLSSGRDGERVLLQVRDTGPGIQVDDLPHIFDRFYRGDKARAADGASGLGLAIARSLVEAHGGRVTVENAPEGGARFTVSLPQAPSVVAATPQR
ncbi:sensor histidine kinase [Promineifilum sp.]|uniref:sensor histidine kinase n=1 Tax=Promineifilum sp. TaxID=2664178 RepID=UPI0035B2E42E